MSNRVIKESIKRSPQIDSLTWFEEVVFYRLIVSADDYGCYDGRPVVLRNELFPTKENITTKSIIDAIDKLVNVGLLCKYTVSDIPYLFFPSWERHQRVRNKRRKYPEPPSNGDLTSTCQQFAASCGELPQNAALIQPNPIQSESNPKTNPTRARDGSSCMPVTKKSAFNGIINSGGDINIATVFQAYDEKIGGQMNEQIRDGLIYYIKQMGAECCIMAMDEAISANVLNWNYVKKVLRNKLAQGVHCKEDWESVETEREKREERKTPVTQEQKDIAARKDMDQMRRIMEQMREDVP